MCVPWDEYLQTYNNMKNTNFKTPKEWIQTIYEKNGKYVSPVERITGVGHNTITRYLEKWGIFERKPPGGNNYRGRKIGKKEEQYLAIPDKTFAELTRNQIAVRCGMSIHTFTRLNRKHQRPYRKLTRD